MNTTESQFVKHIACDFCGSSDARALYDDGHSYCFACNSDDAYQTDSKSNQKRVNMKQLDDIVARRKIGKAALQFYGVEVTESGDVLYPYKKAKKFRNPEKEFSWTGYSKQIGFFGQDKWPENSAKIIIVTEGEFDAIAAFDMLAGRVACVSVENGASGALDSFKRQYKYLDSFDKIIIAFDADEPGKKAALECAEILMHKTFIVEHTKYKDANEYLINDDSALWLKDYNNARQYKPEGIVSIKDVIPNLLAEKPVGISWVFPRLTELTHGRRLGEIYAFGAGVGMGKTDIFTQSIAYDLMTLRKPVGVFYLEQPIDETVLRIAGKVDNKIYHIKSNVSDYLQTLHKLENEPLYLFDHFGSRNWSDISNYIVYLAKAFDVQLFYLDNLTALTASEKDERRSLDALMSEMAALAQKHRIIIHFVSHLTTPSGGEAHEEGARVRERDFTGSRAIARWSHFMFGIEGNKNADNAEDRHKRLFRVIKDRYTGQATGESFGLHYNPKTGILSECAYVLQEDEVL